MTDELFNPDSPAAVAARKRARLPSGKPYISYIYGRETKIAVQVAIAADRPLLLRGDPGCGKSTLARDVALTLGYRYYEEVVTSRTRAQDLMWRFDAVRRLGDATANATQVKQLHRYLEPRALWWAFNPELAARRGSTSNDIPGASDLGWGTGTEGAVVLFDEVDKAEPDVPNDLLVPLGEARFRTSDGDVEVTRKRPALVFITSNGERDLPPAFLRRCVVLDLPRPSEAELFRIAQAHFRKLKRPLFDEVLGQLRKFSERAEELDARAPGTAEFLDALRACEQLQVTGKHPDWALIMRAALWKHTAASEKPSGT